MSNLITKKTVLEIQDALENFYFSDSEIVKIQNLLNGFKALEGKEYNHKKAVIIQGHRNLIISMIADASKAYSFCKAKKLLKILETIGKVEV